MITHLKTAHEERYSDGSRTLGILFNYSSEVEHENWNESFAYVFNHKRESYIFFNTMVDMFDYILYDDKKTKRAYMIEKEFDEYYDAKNMEGKFSDVLKWI